MGTTTMEHHAQIGAAGSTDTYQLIRALEKSVIFDRCTQCSRTERIRAVLDYEARS